MRDRATRRLIALEARRARPVVVQTTLMAAVAGVVLGLVGWLTPARASWLLFAWSLAAPWSLPMSVMRDRLDGGLEFLQALPLSAGRLAAGRLLSAVLFSLPAGVVAAVAHGLTHPGLGGWATLRGASAASGAATVGVAVLAALATGIALRLEARAFANGFGLAFVSVIAVHHLTRRFAPNLAGAVAALAARPWMPHVGAVVLPLLAMAAAWLAFRLARSGMERFTPGRDRVTW
jgi:ABC-type Na+ efflux pump permease subunit